MIIHSPIISGSLTFADGSTFTLPDGGNYSGSFSGSIQISEVRSHLIPNTNEEYDLGSPTNRFRDLYLSANTIDTPFGSIGASADGFGFSDPFGNPAPIQTSEVKVFDEADGSFAKLAVVDGTLTTTAFNPFGEETAFDMKSQLSGSFTGSFLGEMLATNGVVSGSSQITIGSVTGFTAYSASVDGRILIEKGRIDAILATADADKDSFAEIVTLINSVDTTNDNAFASFYTASNDRFDNIEGFTSSIDTTIKTKMDADSVVSGSSQLVSLLPSGVVSSSAQVNADSITNFDSNVKSKLDVDGVISSSVQVDVLQTTNFAEFSSSVADTFGGLSTDYNDLQNIPSGIISSSEQLAADFLDTLGDNVVSSSAQVDLTQTTNYASGIKLKLDAENVFSSSAQVTIGDTNGFSEFSSSVSDTFDGLSSNYEDLVGIPSGIVSGSSQIDVTQTTNYSTVSSHISSTSNPHSVTATQVGLGNVDNTSDADKPVSTATQTALDLKATVVALNTEKGRIDELESFSSSLDGGFVSEAELASATGALETTISNHISDTTNPHSVTATQVGLGNVDNTSDSDKPISTATQTALDLKATVSDLNTEKGRIDAILASSDADKDSFAEIVTLINSVDTTNDTAFAGFVTSSNAAQGVQDDRLTALETETGSIASAQSTQDGRLDALESTVGSLSTDYEDLVGIPSGIVSGSSQVDVTATTNYSSINQFSDAKVKLKLDADGVISSSAQVLSDIFGEDLQLGDITGSNLYLSGNAVIAGNVTIGDAANDTISFAADVSSDILPAASNTYDLGSATDKFAEVHANNIYGTINADNGVISGSVQVNVDDTLGFPEFSSSISESFAGLSTDYVDLSTDQVISGTKTFENVIVSGTGSFAYIQSVTGSAKVIGDAYIILNADGEASQYGGIKVYDSGSGETGSLEYDSENNHWFYESTTEGYASGLIAGPRDTRGAITWPSNNRIVKGIGGNHISNSNISDDGTTISLNSNTEVTGSLTATNIHGTINATNGVISGSEQLTGANIFLGDITGSGLYIEGETLISGNINLRGDITFGDDGDNSDVIGFSAPIAGNLTPNVNDSYFLGNGTNKWAEIHATDINGNIKANNGVVSGSSQVILGDVTGFTDFSSSVSDTFDGLSSNYEDLVGIPSGIVSSSSQVTLSGVTGFNTFSSSVSDTFDGLSSNYVDLVGIPSGIVSGSSQVDVTQTSNYSTIFSSPTFSGTTTVGSISFGDATIATGAGTIAITAGSGISLLTSGGGDGVVIAANGNTTVYGAIALQDIPAAGTATSALVVGGSNVISQRTLGSNAFTSDTYALDSALTTEKNRIDAILASSDADKDSFAEIVTLINSVDTSNDSAFASHATNFNNPHSVTKAQVGLGNVDNTSDANKPVSTATQIALDLKYDASNPAGYTTYTSNQATNTTSNVTFASVSATGDVVAYSSSDRRLKDNIVNIENPIEKVQKLNGVTWDWNDNADELQKSIANVGVIAQEVEEVLPQLVKDRENGYKGVDYAKLTGLLIEAVKEQQKQIDELKSRLG